jgi:hypothetical protein
MAKYLKSLANSLMEKTLPEVGRSVFPNETSAWSEFKQRQDDAKDIFKKASKQIKDTTSGFEGFSAMAKNLNKQLKTGKFGTTEDDRMDDMLGKMDFDFDTDGSSFSMSADSHDTLNHNVVNNIIVDNPIAKQLKKQGGFTKGEAIISEKMSYGIAVNAQMANILGETLPSIDRHLEAIGRFHEEQTSAFYRDTLDALKVGVSLSSRIEEIMDPLQEHLIDLKNKRDARAKKDPNESSFQDKLFDPSRIAKKLTEGNFEMLFGEISPLKGFFKEVSQDPLGMIVKFGISTAVTKMFVGTIDTIKSTFNSLAYRAQGTFENWSKKVGSGFKDTLLRSIGNLLKIDREGQSNVKLGGYHDGAVDFDGKTRKAIVDVIPMYLSKILKAVSKTDHHEVYDYEKGRFTTDKKGYAGLTGKVDEINKGNYHGGIGRELQFLNYNDKVNSRLSTAQREAMRDHLLKLSLRKDSHKIKFENIRHHDPMVQAAWEQIKKEAGTGGLSDLKRAFYGNKYTRLNEMKSISDKLGSAEEHSAILMGMTPGLTSEEGIDSPLRNRRRNRIDALRAEQNQRAGGLGGLWRNIKGGKVNKTQIMDLFGRNADGSAQGAHVNIPGGGNGGFVGKFADALGNFGTSFVDAFHDKISGPLIGLLTGRNSGKRGLSHLGGAGVNSVNGSAVGTNDKNMTLVDAIKFRFDKSIVMPLKEVILGKKAKGRAGEYSFLQTLQFRFDRSILVPLKMALLGKGTSVKDAINTPILKSIGLAFDRTLLMPLKKALLGGNEAKAKGFTIWKAIGHRLERSVFIPMKRVLLGSDTNLKTLKNTSLMSAFGQRFEKSVLLPVKTWMLGGNGASAKRMTFGQVLGYSLNKNLMTPIKFWLLGGEEGGRSRKEAFKTSFFKSISVAFQEKLVQPLNALLFGGDKRKNGFFRNLGETFSPFFNKLLFGQDKAAKQGFMANLKEESSKFLKSVWGGFQDKFIKPLKETAKELFGPVFKEFRSVLGEELKYQWGQLKTTLFGGFQTVGKGLFRKIFGDELVDILRTNILDPLNSLTKKLTDGLSKVFRFLLRIPTNFLKGVTDTMKFNQLKSGRGNFSAAERARLEGLNKSGKFFNFLNLGPSGTANGSARGAVKIAQAAAGRTVTPAEISSLQRSGHIAEDGTVLKPHSSHGAQVGTNIHEHNDRNTVDVANLSAETAPKVHAEAAKTRTGKALTPLNGSDLRLTAQNTGSILGFMRKNMTRLDTRVENILRRLKGKPAKYAGSKTSFFSNPLRWMKDMTMGILKAPFKLLNTATSMISGVVKGLWQIPKQLGKAIFQAGISITKGVLNIIPTLANALGKAVKAGVELLGHAIVSVGQVATSLLKAATKAISSIVEAAGHFMSQVAVPLAKGLASITTTLIKSAVPVINTFVKGLGHATVGLLKLAASVAKFGLTAARGVVNTASRVAGRVLGVGHFGQMGKSGEAVYVSNHSELINLTRRRPLHVYVVDGKIGSYQYTGPMGTRFSKFTMGFKQRIKGAVTAKNDGDVSKGILGGLLSHVGESAIGAGLLAFGAKFFGFLKKGFTGLIALLTAKAAGGGDGPGDLLDGMERNAKRRRSSWLKRTARKLSRSKGSLSRVAGKGLNGVAGLAGKAGKLGLLAKAGKLGMMGLKGVGGIVASLAGDAIIDKTTEKGGFWNDTLHGALTGASIGGTAGSFFGGIGALPGALIGGVGGALVANKDRIAGFFGAGGNGADTKSKTTQGTAINALPAKFSSGNLPTVNASPEQIDAAIKAASGKYGLPYDYLKGMSQIESGGRNNVVNKFGYAGLFQFGTDAWKQYSPNPLGNPLDPAMAAEAAARFTLANKAYLEKKGIPVTGTSLYMAHQQGPGGVAKIYDAAVNGAPLDASTLRNMSTNPPPGAGKAATGDPKSFLSAWDIYASSKLKTPPLLQGTVASGKVEPMKMGATATSASASPQATMSAATQMSNNAPNANASMKGAPAPLVVSTNAPGSNASQNIQQVANISAGGGSNTANSQDSGKHTDLLSQQVDLLKQIAENTKNGGNFFSGGQTSSADKVQSDKVAAAERADDRIKRRTSFESSTIPSYLQPSPGALRVATGGVMG